MKQYKLANVIIDDNRAFHATPLIYVKASCVIVPSEQATSFCICGPGDCDFTTFFNALSLAKWRRYTVADQFALHLEVRGAACTIWQTHAQKLDVAPVPLEETKRSLSVSSSWQAIDLPLVVDDQDILIGFGLQTEGELQVRNSFYSAEVNSSDIRPVELAIATTTFRKEDYITRNIALVRERIIGSEERAANHITMHVVDNGRTLDPALAGGAVYIHPNPNAGGSGGFARGMIEAMEQSTPATHVLLMDDDVEVSPESILRTWNLLALVRDEWSEAFISGSMMSSLQPDLRWEDLGFITSGGFHLSLKPKYRVSSFCDTIYNETIIPHGDNFPDTAQQYAAWWYCCIPISTIEREGLPLPVFVRHDDVEYSLRCKPRFITMNGICIWHDEFTHRYNAAVERYQTMRNCLIMQATTNGAPLSDFVGGLRHNFFVEMAKFNYTDAALILDGFEDFLKGPGFYSAPGKAEETYMAANKRREQWMPYEELRELALSETGVDLNDYSFDDIVRDIPMGLAIHDRKFNIVHTQLFERTINGQLYRSLKPFDNDIAVIEAAGWAISYGRLYGKTTLIVVDPYTKRGTIRHKDKDKFRKLWARMEADLKEYKKNREEIEALYRDSKSLVTSKEFWKHYLGVE